jgi:hypothetical protein
MAFTLTRSSVAASHNCCNICCRLVAVSVMSLPQGGPLAHCWSPSEREQIPQQPRLDSPGSSNGARVPEGLCPEHLGRQCAHPAGTYLPPQGFG